MKKISLTIEDMFNIPTAEIFNAGVYKPVTSVSIDSRNISRNAMFVAIKGKKLDGHKFIKDAVKNGAKAIVINKNRVKNYEDTGIPVIAVKNTTVALGSIAKKWREKLQTKIIGITGSAGKTSTKEMLALLLSEKYNVNKTIANNNNHIGVPLTLFSTNNRHDILVAELGTNHFGEIDYTANITQPDYALITNIGDSHLEYLNNRQGVLKEKLALFEAVALKNGTLFINNDDKLLKKVLKNYQNKVTYGFDFSSDVQGKITSYTEDGKAKIEIKYKDKTLRETVPLYGEQNAKNFLASAAVAFKLGMTSSQISNGIKRLSAVEK
ncbi:MAG: Mur ligase family protein, partial [Ignavibacteriaceae bacterium]